MRDEAKPGGIYRLSSILASTRTGGTECFESLDDMPAVMRAECVRALESSQAATVVIADSAGREFLEGLAVRPAPPKRAPVPPSHRLPRQLALEIILVGGAALALWLLASWR